MFTRDKRFKNKASFGKQTGGKGTGCKTCVDAKCEYKSGKQVKDKSEILSLYAKSLSKI